MFIQKIKSFSLYFLNKDIRNGLSVACQGGGAGPGKADLTLAKVTIPTVLGQNFKKHISHIITISSVQILFYEVKTVKT